VTDSVPVPGRSHGVVKAGVANAVGAYGERLAARYLAESGMQILDRNWRCDQGEIDIVAIDDTCLVIVEVKTRRSLVFGSPVEAVTVVKAARLRRLAACWLADHRSMVDSVADIRIDVIGVLRPNRGPAQIEHLVAVAA
jgi:putative endonuclease